MSQPEVGGSGTDKGSIVFTIVELLLIALLLLCNCLNLVSVLGFGTPQAKSATTSTITDFEVWQRALVGEMEWVDSSQPMLGGDAE